MTSTYTFQPPLAPKINRSAREKAIEKAARCYGMLLVLSTPSKDLRKYVGSDADEFEWIIGASLDRHSNPSVALRDRCREHARRDLAQLSKTALWFDDRLIQLCRDLDLDNACWNMLRLCCVMSAHREFEKMLEKIEPGSPESAFRLLAGATGTNVAAVRAALSSNGGLATYGLLENDGSRRTYRDDLTDLLELASSARNILLDESIDDAVGELFVRSPRTTELAAANFPHYAAEFAQIRATLAGAIDQGAVGVHVLLYGPPGAGKSEMARALVQELDVRAVAVPDQGPDGDDLRDKERLAKYAANQAIARRQGEPTVIVFDEAEAALEGHLDSVMALFGERSIRSSGKGHLNNLLETAAAPTIWLCNRLDRFDPATLRRMTLAYRIDTPPRSVRERLAREIVGEAIPEAIRTRIAEHEEFMPADLLRIATVARLNGGALDDQQAAMSASARVGAPQRRELLKQSRGHLRFTLDWINSAPSVDSLVQRASRRGRTRVGLFGPPGTGKTAFAHHVAEALDRPLIIKRASDLLNMYLGGTEARIAAAFNEAAREESILLIDEIDSFMRDRSAASHSWEVTQVNELLQQIDTFDGYLIVCSNHDRVLDPALSRRLHLKAQFRPMRPVHVGEALGQAAAALGINPPSKGIPPSMLSRLDGITPGDIEAAIECVHLTRDEPDWAQLVGAVESELGYKPEKASSIGFV